MPNLNKVMLMGHLGGDPELKSTANGKNVANFSLATSEKYGEKEQTQWHKIIMWDKLADLAAKHLQKGDAIYIEGKIQYRDYMDKDNIKRYVTEITAFSMQFIKTKGKDGDSTPKSADAKPAGAEPGDDEVPF